MCPVPGFPWKPPGIWGCSRNRRGSRSAGPQLYLGSGEGQLQGRKIEIPVRFCNGKKIHICGVSHNLGDKKIHSLAFHNTFMTTSIRGHCHLAWWLPWEGFIAPVPDNQLKKIIWFLGNNSIMGKGVDFRMIKCFGTKQKQGLHNTVNVLNITELFTLKWLILCYVKFHFKFKHKMV